MLSFNFITLFPAELKACLSFGVLGQAVKQEVLRLNFINPRDFTTDNHKTVDDRPYGGGDGMVMLAEPLVKAIKSLGDNLGHCVYLSPQGKTWNNARAMEFAKTHQTVTFICGRYAGIDERVIHSYVDEEISLGDFVLSGAEPAAMAIVDSISRFVPGVLGNEKSNQEESFQDDLLEAPQFTRPAEFEGLKVPEVLTSGNHKLISEWKHNISVVRTHMRRPDLYQTTHDENTLVKARKALESLPADERTLLGLPNE